jgi:L-lactate utilization protein LutC
MVSTSLIDRLMTTLQAAGAGVVLSTPGALRGAVAGLIREGSLAEGWAAETILVAVDPRLSHLAVDLVEMGSSVLEADDCMSPALATAHVGITPALAAIAESGTVVVGPGDAAEGLLAVLPPHHIVILPEHLIEPDLPGALTRIAPEVARAGTRLVFITGPSRTADIELTTVLGVHGPLRLDVVVVRETAVA